MNGDQLTGERVIKKYNLLLCCSRCRKLITKLLTLWLNVIMRTQAFNRNYCAGDAVNDDSIDDGSVRTSSVVEGN
jgi:hypothetical protein